ncbi:MAG: hypothetical protein IJ684_04540 [Bacteroidales bacterium]|nr:hypothetical protein [Bacteroidales bacterium]
MGKIEFDMAVKMQGTFEIDYVLARRQSLLHISDVENRMMENLSVLMRRAMKHGIDSLMNRIEQVQLNY